MNNKIHFCWIFLKMNTIDFCWISFKKSAKLNHQEIPPKFWHYKCKSVSKIKVLSWLECNPYRIDFAMQVKNWINRSNHDRTRSQPKHLITFFRHFSLLYTSLQWKKKTYKTSWRPCHSTIELLVFYN